MGKQLARPRGASRPLCVCFTVGTCTHPSCNVIAILRAIGGTVLAAKQRLFQHYRILRGKMKTSSVYCKNCGSTDMVTHPHYQTSIPSLQHPSSPICDIRSSHTWTHCNYDFHSSGFFPGSHHYLNSEFQNYHLHPV